MSTNNESILRKIRALVELGKDGGATEAEAENALRFARRLMLANNVSEDDLEKPRDVHEVAAEEEYESVRYQAAGMQLTQWEVYLAIAVDMLVGTTQHYTAGVQDRRTKSGTIDFNPINGKPKRAPILVFYGPAEDARDATALMEEWTLAISSLGRMKFGGTFRGPGKSYCEGFARALYEKMHEIRREEHVLVTEHKNLQLGAEHRQQGLVLVGQLNLMQAKKEHASDWLAKVKGIKLRKSGSSRGGGSHDSNAYGTGRADGQKANFSHSRTKKLGGGK